MWVAGKRFGGQTKGPKPEDLFTVLKMSAGVNYSLRFVGPFYALGMHWLKVRKKDGTIPKNGFPKYCLAVDPVTGERKDPDKCPYCKVLEDEPRVELWQNAINRREQKNRPASVVKPTGNETKIVKCWDGKTKVRFKKGPSSESWTPVVAVRLTSSPAEKISTKMIPRNTRKLSTGEKAFGPEHPKFGFDIIMQYDPDAKSKSDIYYADMDKKTALKEPAETSYLMWDFTKLKPETYSAALREAERILPNFVTGDDKDGDKPKKRRRSDDDEEGEDYEDRPRSKKSSSRRQRDEEDDEEGISAHDEDYGTDGDDEDYKPRSKKASKSSKSSKRAPAKKVAKKSSSRDEDDDDDRPAKKPVKKPVKKASKSSKSSKRAPARRRGRVATTDTP